MNSGEARITRSVDSSQQQAGAATREQAPPARNARSVRIVAGPEAARVGSGTRRRPWLARRFR
ncbi:MAG TPA: hypothetical protein VKQ36_15550 [Ktedonobacterales bacterium]|nr:hypothetical protein [Ktedonobacterales bacterium]